MASDTLVFQSLAQSNIPAREKSTIMRTFEKLTGREMTHGTASRIKAHAMGTVNAIRQGGESAITGAVLGYADAHLKNGLDVNVRGKSVPLDVTGGVLLLVGSAAFAHEDGARDMANVGSTALGVGTYRLAKKLAAKRAKVAGEENDEYGSSYDPNMAGDGEVDSIIEASRRLG